MGLGHGRQRASTGVSQEIWLRDGAERAHSPDHAKGGRQCDLSYRGLHGISATSAREGRFTGTNESACGAVAQHLGNYRRELHTREECPRGGRFFTGVRAARIHFAKIERKKSNEESCVEF